MTTHGHILSKTSKNVAPCDFWLNSYNRHFLNNHSSSESLCEQITEIVSLIPESEYRNNNLKTDTKILNLYIS